MKPASHATPPAKRQTRQSQYAATLLQSVRRQLVPRLHALHLADALASRRQRAARDLAAALLDADPARATACIRRAVQSGDDTEVICLDLIAGAARELDFSWQADCCLCGDVALAAMRLQRMLREMSGDRHVTWPGLQPVARALLLTLPNEQHGLGREMLAQFFRRGGWHVDTPAISEAQDAGRLAAASGCDLVGFSLGSDRRLDVLKHSIMAVRQASRREVIVMVGGAAFIDRPDLACRLGADGTAADCATAVQRANDLLQGRRREEGMRYRPMARRASAGALA